MTFSRKRCICPSKINPVGNGSYHLVLCASEIDFEIHLMRKNNHD